MTFRTDRRVSPLAVDDETRLPLLTRRHALAGMMGSALVPGLAGPLRAAGDNADDGADLDPQIDNPEEIIRAHGYSFFGDLTYPQDFAHYAYVNPDAPRGGEIAVWAPGTFDSFNPYSRRGRAARFSWSFYESLLETSGPFGDSAPADVHGESYGLLAHTVEYPRSKDWVIFHMRPEARFSDGTPLTAHDVVFTHNLFIEQGLPSYAQAVGFRVTGAEALDDHTVRFTFRDGISRRSLIDQVGSTPVFPRRWFQETGARLDESREDTAPGSSPYVLHDFEINRTIIYRRNPDYWGWHLPNNRGRHNFDEVRVLYFADDTVAFERFRTGDYTIRVEGNSRTWATGFDFPAARRGHVKRLEIPDGTPPTPTGFVFNLERPQFADRRVREAVSLAYNFEWTNAQFQHGLMAQRHSFTQGTRLEAHGVPEGAELALLESFGDMVAPELLTEPVVMAHASSLERLQDRRNLRRANRLLEDAGWTVTDDGVRRNEAGQALRIRLPYPNSAPSTQESVIETFMQNLQQMGIDASAQRIDPAQYTLRSRDRDYDMVFSQYAAFLDVGTGLLQRYGIEAADDVFNPAGLRSELVDAVINHALMAPGPEERDVALRVLDRVLRWERFIVPVWYNPDIWIAHWDQFGHPEEFPTFATGELDFWWFDAEAAAALRSAGALR